MILASLTLLILILCLRDYFTSTRFKKWLYKQSLDSKTPQKAVDPKTYAKVNRDAKALERQAMECRDTKQRKLFKKGE